MNKSDIDSLTINVQNIMQKKYDQVNEAAAALKKKNHWKGGEISITFIRRIQRLLMLNLWQL